MQIIPNIKLSHMIQPHKVFIQYNRHGGHTSLGGTTWRLIHKDSFFSFNINVRYLLGQTNPHHHPTKLRELASFKGITNSTTSKDSQHNKKLETILQLIMP